MISQKIEIKNFQYKKKNKNLSKILSKLLKDQSQLILSLGSKYKDNYDYRKLINKFKKRNVRIFGMGGSILGSKAIYKFLKEKIKKKFYFIDNIDEKTSFNKKENFLDLIISKSGNTLETIVNINFFVRSKSKKIFLTENRNSYLTLLAKQLKSEIIHHNNFIGGRFSVLSETGMFPAELMGFKPSNFRKLNDIIKDRKFLNSLITNTSAILHYSKKNYNSVIINYDYQANSLFEWYQQLVSESLGKQNKGILPIISTMPKDNHSVMQHYLDGKKNNFYTFFLCKNSSVDKIKIVNSKLLHKTHDYLRGLSINQILEKQFIATQKVFHKKKLPFRSIVVSKRDENSIGGLFCYFILETILLGRALGINPYNQPAVELIKIETKKQFAQK